MTSQHKELREKLELVEKEIEEAQKSHIAYRLAEELKKGEACPVCGSTHHPSPALQDSAVLSEKIQLKEELSKKEKELEDKIRKVQVDRELLQKNRQYTAAFLGPLEGQFKGLDLEKVIEEKAEAEKEFQALTKTIEEWNKKKKS